MTLNEYQKQAMTTCMESSNNFSYMFIGLVGEVGELASKVAKMIRKGRGSIHNNRLGHPEDEREGILSEAGDCLWMLAGICSVMGWNLEDVGQYNLDKLADRKERNVIDGNGDNR